MDKNKQNIGERVTRLEEGEACKSCTTKRLVDWIVRLVLAAVIGAVLALVITQRMEKSPISPPSVSSPQQRR